MIRGSGTACGDVVTHNSLLHAVLAFIKGVFVQYLKPGLGEAVGQIDPAQGVGVEGEGQSASGQQGLTPHGQYAAHQLQEGLGAAALLGGVLNAVGQIQKT